MSGRRKEQSEELVGVSFESGLKTLLWRSGAGEGGGEILCRDLNGAKESGEERLGRGNSKRKERPSTLAELGRIEQWEGSQFNKNWPRARGSCREGE